jgi:hypothetical protein
MSMDSWTESTAAGAGVHGCLLNDDPPSTDQQSGSKQTNR